ncbi:hypothetical protein D3C73_1341370 [compost metagenome]
MYPVSMVFNRQSPVVIDKQTGIVATPQFNSGNHVGFDLFVAFIFDSQLDSTYACIKQAFNPRNAVDHRVQPEAERDRWEFRLIHQASSFFR